MQERGIQLDIDYVRRGLDAELQDLERAKKEFKINTGRDFIDSGKVFKEIFDERGEPYGLTDKGNPSFTSEVLDNLGTRTAESILAVREREKRASTYWSSFLHYADERGVLRSIAQPFGTKTGRFSYRDPNLQNLPREEEKEEDYIIRRSFVPRPNHVYVAIDFSQQEYRLMLDYANERSLIDAVMAGEDVHSATAKLLNIERHMAKTINFALLYGTGIKKLSKMLRVSEDEARHLKQLYFSRLPNVRRFIEVVQHVGGTRGYIYNFIGRRFFLSDFDYSYTLPNHLIQGSGADVVKKAMVITSDHADIVLQIHDELLFEIPEDKLDVVPRLMELMEGVYVPQNGMELKVSASISRKSFAKQDMEEFLA